MGLGEQALFSAAVTGWPGAGIRVGVRPAPTTSQSGQVQGSGPAGFPGPPALTWLQGIHFFPLPSPDWVEDMRLGSLPCVQGPQTGEGQTQSVPGWRGTGTGGTVS